MIDNNKFFNLYVLAYLNECNYLAFWFFLYIIFSLFKRKRIIKMQKGIKIKSKDINFVISTFYLAINSYFYIFVIIHIKIIF